MGLAASEFIDLFCHSCRCLESGISCDAVYRKSHTAQIVCYVLTYSAGSAQYIRMLCSKAVDLLNSVRVKLTFADEKDRGAEKVCQRSACKSIGIVIA